jgi:hypothetical protein
MTRARDLASTALNSTVNTTELGYLDGVTSSVQTQLDAKLATATASSTYATSSTVTTHTGASTGVHGVTGSVVGTTDTQTLTSKTLKGPNESVTYGASGYYSGPTQIEDLLNQPSFIYYAGSNTGNWTLNLRGNSSTTLSSLLSVGDAKTVVIAVTNGASAFYQTALQIDGTATGVKVKWSGGTAPSAGNASAIDVYSFTIVKTAATPTYTVFAAGPVKYA